MIDELRSEVALGPASHMMQTRGLLAIAELINFLLPFSTIISL